jgi:predicted protein tyrosine phosphatase
MSKTNLLFICTGNRDRSPTAESDSARKDFWRWLLMAFAKTQIAVVLI